MNVADGYSTPAEISFGPDSTCRPTKCDIPRDVFLNQCPNYPVGKHLRDDIPNDWLSCMSDCEVTNRDAATTPQSEKDRLCYRGEYEYGGPPTNLHYRDACSDQGIYHYGYDDSRGTKYCQPGHTVYTVTFGPGHHK